MQKLLLLFLIFLLSCASKNDKTETKNENTDYLLSLDGLDSLKLDMTKAELEKILNTTIQLKHIKIDQSGFDTVPVKYKGADIVLHLAEGDDSTVAYLRGISSSYQGIKTSKGISIGTDKITVIDSYADNLKFVGPVYDEYPARSLTKSVVAVMDTAMAYRAIVFHIINRKVAAMELSTSYEFY